MSQLLTKIDADTFRLRVTGAVDKTLSISLNELRTEYPQDSVMALAMCTGNFRATFSPRVPGNQWRKGSMGNAMWKGVRLKEILSRAGIQATAVDVTFQGLEQPALPGIAPFVKSLNAAHAMDGEVLVAYEMNGQPIPMLNGYPLKLVVPGWYATYWVGALSKITVLKEKYTGYWMTKSYLVPDNANYNEHPDSLTEKRVPATGINLHSIFVAPEDGEMLEAGKTHTIEGLAFDNGTGIAKVDISTDSGRTWTNATLNPVLGKYAWRRWKYNWTPESAGKYQLAVRATDSKGKTQPATQWNRSGYARGFVERITAIVK